MVEVDAPAIARAAREARTCLARSSAKCPTAPIVELSVDDNSSSSIISCPWMTGSASGPCQRTRGTRDVLVRRPRTATIPIRAARPFVEGTGSSGASDQSQRQSARGRLCLDDRATSGLAADPRTGERMSARALEDGRCCECQRALERSVDREEHPPATTVVVTAAPCGEGHACPKLTAPGRVELARGTNLRSGHRELGRAARDPQRTERRIELVGQRLQITGFGVAVQVP